MVYQPLLQIQGTFKKSQSGYPEQKGNESFVKESTVRLNFNVDSGKIMVHDKLKYNH